MTRYYFAGCCVTHSVTSLPSSPVSGTFPVLFQLPNGQTMPVAIPATIASSVHIPTAIPVSIACHAQCFMEFQGVY